MRTIPFAAIAAACVFAFPAFAQVTPTGAGSGVRGSAQAGVSTTGAPSNTGMGMGTTADAATAGDASSTSNLGLGGLLKQTQAGDSAASLDGSASLAGSSDAKALVKKARAHGH